MDRTTVLAALALTLFAVGCSTDSMTVDTGVTLQPGASAELSVTGEKATVRLIPADGQEAGTGVSIAVLSSDGMKTGHSSEQTTRAAAALPPEGTTVRAPGAGDRIVVVNNGGATVTILIHAAGGDGFKIVQTAAKPASGK